MRSFCSKKKFHCPSKVAAARCVMLRTWILGGSFDLWRSWCYSGAKAALSVIWDRPAVVISNTPDFSGLNSSLSFTYATCSVWVWGGSGWWLVEWLEGVGSVVTQGPKLKESPCQHVFLSLPQEVQSWSPIGIFKTFYFILEYSWLTMLWSFQVDSKGTQPYIHIYPISPKLLSHPGCHMILSRDPCALQ